MAIITSRRSFITGLTGLIAAPAIVRAQSLMPVRVVKWSPPLIEKYPGWFVLNGAEVSRERYRKLFVMLGTRWGPGDGSTTFNLPDLEARFFAPEPPHLSGARSETRPQNVRTVNLIGISGEKAGMIVAFLDK